MKTGVGAWGRWSQTDGRTLHAVVHSLGSPCGTVEINLWHNFVTVCETLRVCECVCVEFHHPCQSVWVRNACARLFISVCRRRTNILQIFVHRYVKGIVTYNTGASLSKHSISTTQLLQTLRFHSLHRVSALHFKGVLGGKSSSELLFDVLKKPVAFAGQSCLSRTNQARLKSY